MNKLSIVSGSNTSMSDTECYIDRISVLVPILEFNICQL